MVFFFHGKAIAFLQGKYYRISTEDFLQFVLPSVSEKDLVVFICKGLYIVLGRIHFTEKGALF